MAKDDEYRGATFFLDKKLGFTHFDIAAFKKAIEPFRVKSVKGAQGPQYLVGDVQPHLEDIRRRYIRIKQVEPKPRKRTGRIVASELVESVAEKVVAEMKGLLQRRADLWEKDFAELRAQLDRIEASLEQPLFAEEKGNETQSQEAEAEEGQARTTG
jgi:hypothetical protein